MTRLEDSGGKYWPNPARGSGRDRAENLNSTSHPPPTIFLCRLYTGALRFNRHWFTLNMIGLYCHYPYCRSRTWGSEAWLTDVWPLLNNGMWDWLSPVFPCIRGRLLAWCWSSTGSPSKWNGGASTHAWDTALSGYPLDLSDQVVWGTLGDMGCTVSASALQARLTHCLAHAAAIFGWMYI